MYMNHNISRGTSLHAAAGRFTSREASRATVAPKDSISKHKNTCYKQGEAKILIMYAVFCMISSRSFWHCTRAPETLFVHDASHDVNESLIYENDIKMHRQTNHQVTQNGCVITSKPFQKLGA